MKWYHYLSVGAFIAGWLSKSIKDGIITDDEIKELVNGILDELNIKNVRIIK